MYHSSKLKNTEESESRTSGLDSHPFPKINKDRQINQNFRNLKVTSGKLIGTSIRSMQKNNPMNILVLLNVKVTREIPAIVHHQNCYYALPHFVFRSARSSDNLVPKSGAPLNKVVLVHFNTCLGFKA